MEIKIDETLDHVKGDASAPISVIEFGDFECPICRQAHPAIRSLLDQFPDRIRFAFRHLPLENIRPLAQLAAEASEAAAAQDEFWPYHDMLYTLAPLRNKEMLLEYARKLALDLDRFQADLESHSGLPLIQEHVRMAEKLHVKTSPAFFVNGTLIDVSSGAAQLRKKIHELLGVNPESL
jgi:protein-disulfide isomerase